MPAPGVAVEGSPSLRAWDHGGWERDRLAAPWPRTNAEASTRETGSLTDRASTLLRRKEVCIPKKLARESFRLGALEPLRMVSWVDAFPLLWL